MQDALFPVAAGIVLAVLRRRRYLCSSIDLDAKRDEIRARYHLSSKGFLPETCLERLPTKYDAWEEVALKMVVLNRSRTMRQAINDMALVDSSTLSSLPELRRAYIILCQFAHSYVSGETVPWEALPGVESREGTQEVFKTLPPQLAVPLHTVCRKLGLPCVLTAGIDLWNWKLIDPRKPHDIDNLTTITPCSGTDAEKYFHMIPCAMQVTPASISLIHSPPMSSFVSVQAVAGPVLHKLFQVDELIYARKDKEILFLLRELRATITEFRQIFDRVGELVDMHDFYEVYRPLLNGFYPVGLTLEGVPCEKTGKAPKVEAAKGPSAGQSTMIILFDAMLGVSHHSSAKDFQEEMVTYMETAHRQMVTDFREKMAKSGTVKAYVKASNDKELASAYNECVETFAGLRMFHFGEDFEYHTEICTGLSPLTRFIFSKVSQQNI
jgi:indoleamine 2,3-dioxygenase